MFCIILRKQAPKIETFVVKQIKRSSILKESCFFFRVLWGRTCWPLRVRGLGGKWQNTLLECSPFNEKLNNNPMHTTHLALGGVSCVGSRPMIDRTGKPLMGLNALNTISTFFGGQDLFSSLVFFSVEKFWHRFLKHPVSTGLQDSIMQAKCVNHWVNKSKTCNKV